MYESLTVEDIKDDILGRMSSDIDVREGSYTNDMISAVAFEIWKAYQALDAIIPIAFVDETSGEYIDKRCAEYGIKRKEGTKATAVLTLSGTNGVAIPKGKVFLTSEGLEFITDKDTIITDGIATVTATAAEIGEIYNVAAGTITRQIVNLNGLISVTNAAATGGNNPEADNALLARLYNFLQRPATSGNVAHYRQWALEVTGCGDAKVFPLWNGPGTVKVLVVDENMGIDISLPALVADHIETVRPIGAAVTVDSPTGKSITVSAGIILDGTKILDEVRVAFSKAFSDYLKSIVFNTYVVSYAKIGSLLLATEGINDYTDLLLNNGSANITLSEMEMPVAGTVTLTEVL